MFVRLRNFVTVALISWAFATPSASAIAAEVVPGVASFDWLRGRFPEASAVEKARWQALKHEALERAERETAKARQDLVAEGVKPIPLPREAFGDELASLVLSVDKVAGEFDSWQAFDAAIKEARPVFEGFRYATTLAEDITNRPKDSLADRLRNSIVGEQVVRIGLGWGHGQAGQAPALSSGAQRVMAVLLLPEVERRDKSNTSMLKAEVSRNGWPLISVVGVQASTAAWLLVQHADNDPAFQVRALHLMQPLLSKSEVSKSNYAYLYDRVMLRLTGRQRFGTQFTCSAGRRVPEALEEPNRLDQLRAESGLEPIATYTAMMERAFGKTCS